MPKYYIPEFYIKNFFLSLLGLVLIAFAVSFIFNYTSNMYFSYGSSILIAITGATVIGYYNAASSRKEKQGKPLFLHLFLIILLFIINSVWGDLNVLINFLRDFSYLVFYNLVFIYLLRKMYLKKMNKKLKCIFLYGGLGFCCTSTYQSPYPEN